MTRRTKPQAVPAGDSGPRRQSALRLSEEERRLLRQLQACVAPGLARPPGMMDLIRESALTLAAYVTAAPRGPRVRYRRELELRRALREQLNLRSTLAPGMPETP